jgi:plastocyanin
MQPRLFTLVFALEFALLSESVSAQSVEGRVELPKPAAERIVTQRYQAGPEMAGPPDPPAAVVYLEGVFPVAAGGHNRPVAQMAQKNLNFGPGILPIQVGTTVEFPNLDDTYHNVFSYSKTKRFDLGRYRKNENPGMILFDKPGAVTLHCEIHGTMRGTILVLESPYFQKTDAQGFYHLGHLPTGRYLLKAWVNDADVRSQPVVLSPGGVLHVDFPAR